MYKMQSFLLPDPDKNQSDNYTAANAILSPYNRSDWGPKRDPLLIVIPISILYVVIFLSGVLGNVSTCIVIARNKSMHTDTNYYLFSLAISDLLLLISGLPPEIYSIWSKYPYVFGDVFCVIQGVAAETSANATVLTIAAFTVERYVAICHPFLSHTLSKLHRAIKFIVMIWIIAMVLAVPQAMAFGVYCEELPDGTTVEDHCVCTVKRSVIPHAFEISTFVFFVTPMVLLSVLYILIGLQLHRSMVGPSRGNSVKMRHRVYKPVVTSANHQPGVALNGVGEKSSEEEDGRKNFAKNAQATKHVVKMLVAVVVAFFICWAPFHAQRLLAIYGKHTSAHMIRAFQILTYISGVFYYLSTTVNPLLYHIMSHKFREAFKATYQQCCREGHAPAAGRCYSTLSPRSSHLNSYSNTDSYSRQNSLRYRESEVARLHESRRPLVISFRRKKQQSCRIPRKAVILDEELQEALDSLKECRKVDGLLPSRAVHSLPVLSQFDRERLDIECSFVEVHSLEPTQVGQLRDIEQTET